MEVQIRNIPKSIRCGSHIFHCECNPRYGFCFSNHIYWRATIPLSVRPNFNYPRYGLSVFSFLTSHLKWRCKFWLRLIFWEVVLINGYHEAVGSKQKGSCSFCAGCMGSEGIVVVDGSKAATELPFFHRFSWNGMFVSPKKI